MLNTNLTPMRMVRIARTSAEEGAEKKKLT